MSNFSTYRLEQRPFHCSLSSTQPTYATFGGKGLLVVTLFHEMMPPEDCGGSFPSLGDSGTRSPAFTLADAGRYSTLLNSVAKEQYKGIAHEKPFSQSNGFLKYYPSSAR
jgi:hypothetical protein